jgi:hypothetical protein
MQSQLRRPRRHQHGSILLTALAFVAFTSMVMAGLITMAYSHNAVVRAEGDYARALTVAEAGINYELRKISQNAANADQPGSTAPYGVSYSPAVCGGGSFRVGCTNIFGNTWLPAISPQLFIGSTGTYNGVSRTLRITANGRFTAAIPSFACFGLNSVLFHAGNSTCIGDVGTGGTTSLHGHISKSYWVCGPGATGTGAGAGAPTVVLPYALLFPTVDQIALQQYPNSGATAPGGVAYISTHNDNASVGLPASGATITSSITLGPGNYYVTGVNMSLLSSITCNNTNGPVNIWVGPVGGAGVVNFSGLLGSGLTATSTLPANQVTFYVATTGGVTMTGSPVVTANFYAVNLDSLGNYYGPISGWNQATINGSAVGASIFQSGNTLINYPASGGMQAPMHADYYGAGSGWMEPNIGY